MRCSRGRPPPHAGSGAHRRGGRRRDSERERKQKTVGASQASPAQIPAGTYQEQLEVVNASAPPPCGEVDKPVERSEMVFGWGTVPPFGTVPTRKMRSAFFDLLTRRRCKTH